MDWQKVLEKVSEIPFQWNYAEDTSSTAANALQLLKGFQAMEPDWSKV